MYPTYTYKCPKCGWATDRNHKPGTRLKLDCPGCGTRMEWRFPHPRLHTDTSLHLGDGFTDNVLRQQAYRQARAIGINPNGKTFMPGLADKRGYQDPAAWVDQDNFRASVKKVCHQRGHGCEGTVNVKARETDGEVLPPYEPDPHMVAKDVERLNQAEHGGQMTPKAKREKLEQLTEQYAGNQ